MRGTILLALPDSRGDALQVAALQRKGFQTTLRYGLDEADAALAEARFDAVVLDLDLSDDGAGLAWCAQLTEARPELPVVVVAGDETVSRAVASMRAGAYDFLVRPLRVEELTIALDRAVENRNLRRQLRRLRKAVGSGPSIEGIVGSSPAMRNLGQMIEKVAASEAPVLVSGETGTGKELVAHAVHHHSKRAKGPFVAVNCAAMPEALLESELFGHVRGAFTDARSNRAGLFAKARGGTLFLDEIGDMPVSLQPKLLRALQDRRVRPVGSDQEVEFDARVISATHRDLEQLVADGSFRQDLYFRINVIQLDLPPLRARGTDILQLARHFLALAAARAGKDVDRLGSDVARALMEYRWPGNVRELENVIERAVALTSGREVGLGDLPSRLRAPPRSSALPIAVPRDALLTMAALEDRYVRHVMQAVAGNKSRAARILGFDRKTLYRKLARLDGLPPEEEPD